MKCDHNEIDWEPIEWEYGTDGTVAIWQLGKYTECRTRMVLHYDPQTPYPLEDDS